MHPTASADRLCLWHRYRSKAVYAFVQVLTHLSSLFSFPNVKCASFVKHICLEDAQFSLCLCKNTLVEEHVHELYFPTVRTVRLCLCNTQQQVQVRTLETHDLLGRNFAEAVPQIFILMV